MSLTLRKSKLLRQWRSFSLATLALSFAIVPRFVIAQESGPSSEPPQAASDMATIDPALIEQQNRFTFELLRHLAEGNDENFFCSPVNVHMALALIEAGAAGQTQQELRQVLYGDRSIDAEAYSEYIRLMNDGQRMGVEMRTASHLWIAERWKLLPAFVDPLKNQSSSISGLDFRDVPSAIDTINDWVQAATNELIEELASRETINESTQAFLASAIYFQGDWGQAFCESMTQPLPFQLADGRTKDVETMVGRLPMRIIEADGFRVGFLPYNRDIRRMEMAILLPSESSTIDDVMDRLNPSELDRVLSASGQVSTASVRLPKMDFETEYELGATLQTLGVREAFGNRADFSQMTESGGLKIEKVIHKAVIKVDEQGTEARSRVLPSSAARLRGSVHRNL